MADNTDLTFKILIIGEPSVGKVCTRNGDHECIINVRIDSNDGKIL